MSQSPQTPDATPAAGQVRSDEFSLLLIPLGFLAIFAVVVILFQLPH